MIHREPTGPDEESVWDYPRPPALESVAQRIQVTFAGITIIDSLGAWRVLETSHPPTYYVPQSDIRMEYFKEAGGGSFCEWKGAARYWDLEVKGRGLNRVAWSYPTPTTRFAALRDHLAIYAGPMDECRVGGELVTPQPGGFYGGWITPSIKGPFKGAPGTMGW